MITVDRRAVTVTDDGVGMPAGADAGSGLGDCGSGWSPPAAGSTSGRRGRRDQIRASSRPSRTDRPPARSGGQLVISVLLVDDQALIRQAFAALLELETDLTVVGQAADAATAVALVADRRPDVVLMDVQLGRRGGEDGMAATAASWRPIPGPGSSC